MVVDVSGQSVVQGKALHFAQDEEVQHVMTQISHA